MGTKGDGTGVDDVSAALEALDAARRRFVNVVGHELRTPVTTLRGLAEELVAGDGDDPELAPAILRNARRVEELLDDLLLATDIVTALPVGEPEPVDLVAAAQATWDALEPAGDLELDGATEAVAIMREGAADTLLHRVLDNAVRYGEAPWVLHSEVVGDRVRLRMSSGGAELGGADVDLAFELFYRGEGAVTTAPGFGLGLPVARALARHDGGDLTLEAGPAGGLDVLLDLPAAG
jgi:signal transduction histidine kinase